MGFMSEPVAWFLTLVIGLALALGAFLDSGSNMGRPPEVVWQITSEKEEDPLVPRCWEDEVLVLVVVDPYNLVTEHYGCVPADNLPVTGFRPMSDN